MKRRVGWSLMAVTAGSLLLLSNPTAAVAPDGSRIEAVRTPADGAAPAQTRGRYKREGGSCVWSTEDSGPNQCEPQIPGRFKKNKDGSCQWDRNDKGPDQCTPSRGRWKKEGDRCVWTANDSGPNQCNPRQPR
jgi:hypothetical protein